MKSKANKHNFFPKFHYMDPLRIQNCRDLEEKMYPT